METSEDGILPRNKNIAELKTIANRKTPGDRIPGPVPTLGTVFPLAKTIKFQKSPGMKKGTANGRPFGRER